MMLIDSSSTLSAAYCTITVRPVLLLRLPDLAVTVAVYVPAGVPGVWDDELPPPHAARPKKNTAIIGIASAGFRRR